MKTIILGAGITGLTAGYETGAEIYEASDEAGGLCKSRTFQDFRYEESGGHWIFGMTPEVYELFAKLDVDCCIYKKRTGVYLNTIIDGNIQDYANQEVSANEGSMKEFLLKRFGKQLCNLFFIPFNERYTKGAYEQVLPECEYKSPSKKTSEYNETFVYPKRGLSYLIKSLANKCKINYNLSAISVDTNAKSVLFSDGSEVKYDKLISTIPLNNLLEIIGIEKNLPYVTTYVANIYGDKGDNYPSHQWLYTPYSPFYRIGFYNNVSSMFAPEGKCMIYAETTDKACTSDIIIKELEAHGIIKNAKVASSIAIPVAYTYRTEDSNVDEHIKCLEEKDIYPIGRFSKWKFQGITESITDGLHIKEKLC